MQGALATAFIEPPLAQTEVRGENRGGVGWGGGISANLSGL